MQGNPGRAAGTPCILPIYKVTAQSPDPAAGVTLLGSTPRSDSPEGFQGGCLPLERGVFAAVENKLECARHGDKYVPLELQLRERKLAISTGALRLIYHLTAKRGCFQEKSLFFKENLVYGVFRQSRRAPQNAARSMHQKRGTLPTFADLINKTLNQPQMLENGSCKRRRSSSARPAGSGNCAKTGLCCRTSPLASQPSPSHLLAPWD